jgi:hypothetical protein
MSTYSRNFEFRATPKGANRSGRFYLDDSAARPIGVPVVKTNNVDAVGRQGVALATGDQVIPKNGLGGILVVERIFYHGVDPMINTYSDLDLVADDEACQVVSGLDVKVAFTNTTATTFLSRSGYPTARVMVAGIGIATPTVAVGDYLTPGTGNNSAGYWAETATAANAWLVVTAVDNSTGMVEARINF